MALSNLLIGMAPHVSRFLTRLFTVDTPAAAIGASTRAQDDLFRFKVDFVRRRALPLVKGGAHVETRADDDAVVEALVAEHPGVDRELAVARTGCTLLDLEKTQGGPTSAAPSPQPQPAD